LSLGLLGSIGSILTEQVLVYWVRQDKKLASASSLAILGMVAIVGRVAYFRVTKLIGAMSGCLASTEDCPKPNIIGVFQLDMQATIDDRSI
tara:strand:- start:315 stop:587 length:273 start_codon:yes stop_codon:yes gene_type:complete